MISSTLLVVAALAFPSGEATIRGPAGPSDIVITTTNRLAGAVHSLTWQGEEFIDSVDHGRQLQSAASFDCARNGEFWPEAFNPTEAGSRRDHIGPRSTSVLLKLARTTNSLETLVRPAFWLNPGERSSGRLALTTTPLSDHRIKKQLTIGVPGIAHAIDYRVTFTVPNEERHTLGQFEILTGYMPAKFSRFESFNSLTSELAALDDGPGEQSRPVVVSTPSGGHAMGIIAFERWPNRQGPTFGRFRFDAENVVKWNVVSRVRDPRGEYAYRVFVAVGSRENVRMTFLQLHAAFGR
jgi:hypothetical protein